MNNAIILTEVDRQILNSYASFLHGLANYLGDAYEIVLHSLEDYEHSVVAIINGEHTGRKIGAPITNLALDMLDKLVDSKQDNISYFSTNKKGEPLKSATISIRGENNRIIGLLCMNLYLNTPLVDVLNLFMSPQQQIHFPSSKESFVENSSELIESSLKNIKAKVDADNSISVANKNKVIISMLNSYGIFNIKDSVIKVAELLNISKNTVYMHLRNANESNHV